MLMLVCRDECVRSYALRGQTCGGVGASPSIPTSIMGAATCEVNQLALIHAIRREENGRFVVNVKPIRQNQEKIQIEDAINPDQSVMVCFVANRPRRLFPRQSYRWLKLRCD
jgi:hypothetical protein